MATRIATEITWTGYPTKNIVRSINNIDPCVLHGTLPYTFVHFGGFLCIKDAGQNHCVNIFHYHHDHCFACTCKISHERHKGNTFLHIQVLNSTDNLTFINHTFDCESEVVVLIGKSHDLNGVTYMNGFKREHFAKGHLSLLLRKLDFTICCILFVHSDL